MAMLRVFIVISSDDNNLHILTKVQQDPIYIKKIYRSLSRQQIFWEQEATLIDGESDSGRGNKWEDWKWFPHRIIGTCW